MHAVRQPAPANGIDRVTGLVCALVNPKPFAAILEHLRHERHPLQLTVPVQCRQDFLLASYFHPLADFKSELFVHSATLPKAFFILVLIAILFRQSWTNRRPCLGYQTQNTAL